MLAALPERQPAVCGDAGKSLLNALDELGGRNRLQAVNSSPLQQLSVDV
jgi:hypothetical protein